MSAAVVSPSGTPVARFHAEILDEKPSSRVAFVFALSLHPRQTPQIVTCGTCARVNWQDLMKFVPSSPNVHSSREAK